MANVRLDLSYEIFDGTPISFYAPCRSTEAENLVVYYQKNGEIVSQIFNFKDAQGNNITNVYGLFEKDECVKVILSISKSSAYIQNMPTSIIHTTTNKIIKGAKKDILKINKIYGKTVQNNSPASDNQLIPYPYNSNYSKSFNVEFSVRSDGGIYVYGTPSSTSAIFYLYGNSRLPSKSIPEGLVGGETYTLSGCSSNINIYISFKKEGVDTVTSFISQLGKPVTFEVPTGYDYCSIYMSLSKNTALNETIYPMLNKGEEVLPFEIFGKLGTPNPDNPEIFESIFSDNRRLGLNVFGGKNLLYINAFEETTSVTKNGVKFTLNDDYSITIKGTSTSYVMFSLNWIDGYTKAINVGDYILSGGDEKAQLQVMTDSISTPIAASTGGDVPFTIEEGYPNSYIRVNIEPNVTVDTIIYPMVRFANIEDNTFDAHRKYCYEFYNIPQLNALKVNSPEYATYTDENGQMWVADEINLNEGVLIQRIKTLVLDGSENFIKYGKYFQLKLEDKVMVNFIEGISKVEALCTHALLDPTPRNPKYYNTSGYFYVYGNPKVEFNFGVDNIDLLRTILGAEASEGKPVTFMYALKEPIKIPLDKSFIDQFSSLEMYDGDNIILPEGYPSKLDPDIEISYGNTELSAKVLSLENEVKDSVKYGDIVDNLVSTATNLPLSAKQGNVLDEKISELNTKMEWKKAGSSYNTNSISVPSTAKEVKVMVIVKLTDTTVPLVFDFSYINEFPLNSQQYRTVGYYYGSNDCASIGIGTSVNGVWLQSSWTKLKYNGTEYTLSSVASYSIHVYYR